MPFFVFFLIGVVLIIFQSTLLPAFPEWLARPDFLFVLVAFAAYTFSWVNGLVFVFILGWMVDSISSIYLGVFPLQYILVFSFLKLACEKSPLKEVTYQIPLVAVSYFVVKIVFYTMFAFLLPYTLSEMSWVKIIQETIILVIVTVPMFLLLSRLYEYLSTKRIGYRVMRKKKKSRKSR